MVMAAWASRGYDLMGVEIKTDRGDVLREFRDPSKAEAIQRYCDRFWLVVGDKGLISKDELPETWGLLVPHGKGLRAAVKAPRLQPEPWPRAVTAALIRSGLRDHERALRDAHGDGFCQGRKAASGHDGREREQLDEISAVLKRFTEITGIYLSEWTKLDQVDAVAHRFKLLNALRLDNATWRARRMAGDLAQLSKDITAAVEAATALDDGARVQHIKEALGLLNSMVLGGESHSAQSQAVVEAARAELATIGGPS